MERDESSRISFDIDANLKEALFACLSRQDLTLDEWFKMRVLEYLRAHRELDDPDSPVAYTTDQLIDDLLNEISVMTDKP